MALRFASNQNLYSNSRIYSLSLDLIEQTTQTIPSASSSESTTNTTTITSETSTYTSTDPRADNGIITIIAIAAVSTIGLLGMGFVTGNFRSRRFDKALGELEDAFKLGEESKGRKE